MRKTAKLEFFDGLVKWINQRNVDLVPSKVINSYKFFLTALPVYLGELIVY